MFDILDIIRRNNATYRNYESGHHVGRLRQVFCIIVLSILLSVLCHHPSNEFLGGVLSALAILVGFSFNVLFYLVANRLVKPVVFQSIEHELKFGRLRLLADEVFDSTAYFSIIAMMSIVLSLLLLLANGVHFSENIHFVLNYQSRGYSLLPLTKSVTLLGLEIALCWTLYFSVIESIITFVRTVQRVRFYFTLLRTIES